MSSLQNLTTNEAVVSLSVPAGDNVIIIDRGQHQSVTLTVGENAQVVYIPIVSGDHTTQRTITLEAAASIKIRSFILGGIITEEVSCHHVGNQAESSHQGVFLGKEHDRFTLYYWNQHTAEHTVGHILVHGALFDQAYADFKGNTKIAQTGHDTDASLVEETLLLGDRSRSDSVPQLEIETNDVRATHSSAITKIDAEQLFYLESRGVPQAEARHLIVEGFLTGLVNDIPDETIATELTELLLSHINRATLQNPL